MLLANAGHNVFYEFSNWAFLDKNLFPTLHEHSYIQFALPSGGSYDPVCFDIQRRVRDDAPIIQLDHEEILIRRRIRVVQEIAPTFTMFVKRAIEEKFAVK